MSGRLTVNRPLVVSGWSLHLPGVPVAATVTAGIGRPRGDWAHQEHLPPERAGALVGRRGLLALEPATRLALCAVHRALRLPPGRPVPAGRPNPAGRSDPAGGPVPAGRVDPAGGPAAAGRPDPATAVVACGNLGNVETVARIARAVTLGDGRAVSVLDAPNVSSNVVASTIGQWFGFGGPNLMVCSGETAGFDGLGLAGVLLRAGRAARVVLVGVEPADAVARALRPTVRAGAACLVLTAGPGAPGRCAAGLLHAVPAGGHWPRRPEVVLGHGGQFDPDRYWGDFYGGHGVVGLALAAHLAIDEGRRVVGVRDSGTGRAVLVCAAGTGRPR